MLFLPYPMTKEREPAPSSTPAKSRETAFQTLRSEVQDVLWQAEEVSAKRVQIPPYPSLEAWGAIKIARNRENHHVLRYNPRYERHLDYLVLHECGHLLRLWSVPPEERPVPVVTRTERTTVYHLLLREFRGPLRALPERALAHVFRMLHEGIVRQVTSFPADMRIEGWMFEECPGMRGAQVTALVEQLRENEMVLRPEVRDLTPRTVYRASLAINSAFAQFLAPLLGEPTLLGPYPNQPREEAHRLLREVAAQRDPGHLGDVAISKRWSEILGLSGWFRWTTLGDAPGTHVSFNSP